MLKNQDSSLLNEDTLSLEEVFGPPKIDLIGFGLILLIALVTGFFAGVGVLIFAFLTSSKFSIQSGASPMLFAMVAFFCLTFANYIYIWGLSTIFPQIYTKTKTVFVQVSVFSVILYIIMEAFYLTISSMYPGAPAVLGIFTFHVLVNIFGVVLLTGLLSQYKYTLLIFYADLIALVISILFVAWIYLSFSSSESSLFILMALCSMSFFITTTIAFGTLALYYQMYRVSGSDPIGDVFTRIETEEKELEKQAEAILLTRK